MPGTYKVLLFVSFLKYWILNTNNVCDEYSVHVSIKYNFFCLLYFTTG